MTLFLFLMVKNMSLSLKTRFCIMILSYMSILSCNSYDLNYFSGEVTYNMNLEIRLPDSMELFWVK